MTAVGSGPRRRDDARFGLALQAGRMGTWSWDVARVTTVGAPAPPVPAQVLRVAP